MKELLHLDFTKINKFPRDYFNVATGKKWANKELQEYVDDETHLFLTKEGLNIKATYDEDGVYRSTRINTRGNFSFTYGRIDIEARLPMGKGTWPALWMMSEDGRYGRWPKSGEIDIMEHVGRNPGELILCIHTEAYNHRQKEQYYSALQAPEVKEGFHRYSLEWKENRIIYYLDDEKVVEYVSGQDGRDATHRGWPFDHPFYLIMNLAVGGMLGGEPDADDFPQTFVIKSIQVRQ